MREFDLEIPVDLGGITLRQYQDYLKLYETWDKEDETYIKIKMLQIFCGLSPENINELPLSSFDSVISHLLESLQEETPLIDRFYMDGKNSKGEEIRVTYGFIPSLDKMSFGEYIDLNTYINDWSQMHKAMAVLFRPTVVNKKTVYDIEKYQGSYRYSDVMLDMPVSVALGAIVFFLSFNEQITQTYSGLFSGGNEEREGGFSVEGNFGKRWGFYQSVYSLCKGDVTRVDEVTSSDLHKCLVMLSYEKDKNNVESQMMKRQLRKKIR